MQHLIWKLIVYLFAVIAFSICAQVQTATYHLHKEAPSTSALFQLMATGPEGTSLAVQSTNLKNQAAGEYLIKAFDTQSQVPDAADLIPAN